ncbi:MAG: ERCC4 domain protein [Promethearchaeota archaeon CR_4]|nr:MAG: ERCC4 domain protein [Candidatus Lokiarchaeota archaeon CR_4]
MTSTIFLPKPAGISKEFIIHPLLQPNKIEGRQYQDNIFASIYGQDALVVLTMGLGKTIAAILQAAERLTSLPESKVVLLAPTKPLAAQHQKTFGELMNFTNDQLLLFTGSTPPTRGIKLWEGAKIVFMTLQVLQNDLKYNRYSLVDVSLLVFDEAHQAVGEYAYTGLATEYFKQAKNPRVLCITHII